MQTVKSPRALKSQPKPSHREDANPADVARALDSLASTYGNIGEWEQACNAYKETLILKKRAYGGQHEEIIKTLDLLAMTLIEQSRFMDAAKPVKEALDIYVERGLGMNTPK